MIIIKSIMMKTFFWFFNTDLFDETIFETSKKLIYSNHKIGKGDIAKIIFRKIENPYNIKITDSTEYDSKTIYEFDHKDIKYFTENGNFNVISDNKFYRKFYQKFKLFE